MNINDFESGIEEKILARGRKYFAVGLVTDIWSESPGRYQAVVEGNIPYDVEIQINSNREITYHCCDCPYDWGEYCKHEVAVLLTIRKHLEKGTKIKNQGQKRGLRALLLEKSKDELIDLLYELAIENDLREDIIYHFQDIDDE